MSLHWHKYELIAVRRVRVYDDSFGPDRFGVARTTMLLRCSRCNKPKTKEIDGVWTLDQLGGGNG